MSEGVPIKLYRRTKRKLKGTSVREIGFYGEGVRVSATVEPNTKPRTAYVIKNFDVLESNKRREGYGTAALEQIKGIARNAGASSVVAEDVFPSAVGFWTKKNFLPSKMKKPIIGNINYIFRLKKK